MLLLVALVSVLVPLSLCVVPALARLTVFPLLTSLVNRFASAYLQPCLRVEYAFGAWEDRAGAPSGVTISLFFVKLANAFLATLAFAKQGVAPAVLTAVEIKQLTLHLATTWKVVLEVEDVDVDATLVDPNAAGAFEVKDAVVMKLNEANGWLGRLLAEKAKVEKQQQLAAQTSRPKAFSFKDRVVQLIMAQVEVKITNVRVNVTSAVALLPAEGSVAPAPTRATLAVSAVELSTLVKHENAHEALELVLSSEDIRVQYTILIKDFGVHAQKVLETAQATAAPDTLKGGAGDGAVALLSLPELELKVEVPPMARVLGIVENLAPVPLAKRQCRVELVLGGTNRVTLAREMLASVLRDLYVPYMDHQTLVKSIRLHESDKAASKPTSADDRAFYVANYSKVDTNAALSADEKTTRAAKLSEIEESLSLDDVVKLRSHALGLAAFFRSGQDELSLADAIAVAQECAAKPENIQFKAMQIALRLESLSVAFVEADMHVAEFVFSSFGVNLSTFAVPDSDDKRTQDIEVMLEHVLFVVNKASSATSPAASPASKIVFADFSRVAARSDALTRPQVLTAHIVQYQTGKQSIEAGLNHLQVVVAADALEYFLMSVDRLSTSANHAMAAARPAFEAIVPVEKPEADALAVKPEEAESKTKIVSMAPFSLLRGKELELRVAMDDCHVFLTPARTFAKSFYSSIDVDAARSDSVVNCRIDLPLSVRVEVESTQTKESVELKATTIGVLARYIEGADECEPLLAPTSFSVNFLLEQDAANPHLCHEKVSMQMPDFVFAFSDLSLALVGSCLQALGGMQTTTPEQAQLKLESKLKQDEMRRQAELDVILARMRRLFEDIDTNHNGQIELGELLLLLRRVKVGDSLLESELEYFVRVLFDEIDRDGNGYLEFDELRSFLHDDLLAMNELPGSGEYTGTSGLSGSLNLRGGEYRSVEVLEKLCDARITSIDQFKEFMAKPNVQARFWDLFESETRVVNHSFGDQSPLDVQKKLIRLLSNYEAAQFCWETVVAPNIDKKEQESVITAWLVQPFTHCGGVSEYQSAALVIAKRKREGIFGAALGETEHLVAIAQHAAPTKKQLKFSTDLQLGNLRFVLTDAELPARFCRGDLNVKDVTVSFELGGKEIDETGPVDWVGLATSQTSEWTALFGVHLSASCYSELASDMDSVIEPWELMAGLNSVEGENGFSVLVEAAKRFQINITPELLKTYRTLMDVVDGEAEQDALQMYQEGVSSALSARTQKGPETMVQNFTGCKLALRLNGEPEEIVVDSNDRVYVAKSALVAGKATLDGLKIAQWGETSSVVELPVFGSVNLPVVSDTVPPSTLFVSAFCRFEDPLKQRLAFKSNLFFCNHSSQVYQVKYLILGSGGREAVTSQVFTLRPNERMSLPLTLLMGMTEIYARPEHFDQWIIKASLNNDILTSTEAISELNEYEKSREAAKQQRRGGTIVYGETEESCTKVLKQLAPNMLIRRWHLRSHFEWEVSLLPPFVVRNSLPYKIEYRFMEYRSKSARNVNSEFSRIERVLRAEEEPLAGDVVLTGGVESGQDIEIAGVSCLAPGYIAIRVVSASAASPWSKPMLMAIHAPLEQFSIAREHMALSDGAQFSVDRLSLPGLPRVVRFFSPYWVMNSTSFDFALASTSPGAKASSFVALDVPSEFTHPIITSLEHDRLSLKPLAATNKRPPAWDFLGKVTESSFRDSPLTEDVVKSARWSEPMNTTTINTVGEFVCGPAVFAVKVEGLFGMFEQGVGLTLSPRFYVQNRTREKIFLQSFGSTEADVEKVSDLFEKRSAADVEAFQVAIENGETSPVYHFAPLKKGEALSACQKFVSLSFSSEWGGDATEKWSFAIPINSAGDLYVQMYSPSRQKDIICQASVQVIDMYVYVILSDVSSSPPYRIENFTPFTIDCAQLGESSLFRRADKEETVTVKPGEWHAFAWYNPLSKDRNVEIRVSHRDAPHSKTKTYDIDYVGYHDPITLELAPDGDKSSSTKKKYELVVQVVVDESTRVFKFMEKELEMNRLESQEAQFENEFQQRKMLYASSFDIRLAGFGLSLLDGFPQEVFFASLDVLQVQKAPASLEWVFSVFNLQLDDMLTTAKFPVILNPIDAGYSDHSVGKEPKPLLRLVLDADLAAKIGTYKLLEVDLSSVAFKVDIDYLVNLVHLIEPYLVSDATVANRSARTLEQTLNRRVPPVPIMQLTVDGNIHHDLVYFDVLRIHAITIDLEYSITRKDIVSSTGGGRSVVFGFLSQVIGLVGSNLSGSPTLSFSEIVIARCFSTKQRLQNQLVQNYIRQGVLQAYRLVGSADIIGNPIGLVEDLGSGVLQFLKITKGEVLGDAQTRGEGVKVLGKTIVKSGASTVAKITGSLDKFVGEFADEDDKASKENKKPTTGIAPLDGGIQFAKDFGKGLTGIFTKPVEGAMRGGVTGLVQGTVSGIAGPGVVLLKQLTSTTHSMALGVQSTVVDRSPFGGRRRAPKQIVNNKLIAEFDASHYTPRRLQLEVVGASGLLSDDSCDPLCVVRVNNKVVLKTRVLYNTLNPVWQEKAQLELTGSEEEVQLVVKDSYGAIDKTIGKTVLTMAQLRDDFKPPEHSSNLAEWVKTGVKPDDTKKNVSHQVKEKEYDLLVSKSPRGGSALLSLGGSATKLRAAENEFQVIVTIVSLEELKTDSSSGGGMLGLGNLVSSTPNISPYVSVHVGPNVNRTNIAKIKFASPDKKTFIGSAEWNETFTFPFSSKDFENAKVPAAVTLSLKDKSMLHDERLGRATRALHPSMVGAAAGVERLKLTAKGDDTGAAIGFVNVKVELVSASVATSTPPGEPEEEETKGDDAPPTPKAQRTPRAGALGNLKAGKIRVACEFV
ncbi:hypothetical protein PybrP1_008807 [[Pythium] brassicae (nom. inval.)]|nr:hypothetical protein PybrP1_008807 [[Pythium] brassicae (nom. inval.)]